MAIIDWPSSQAFKVAGMSFGAVTPKSAFTGFFTGSTQTISHLSDRLRCSVRLNMCNATDGQQREGWLIRLASSGDWIRLRHFHRDAPLGTMRGTPTAQASALAGARVLSIQTTAGATLIAGDMIGVGTQLLMVGSDATANGSGVMSVTLALPLVSAVTSGAAITWSQPTGYFQLVSDGASVSYEAARMQQALELSFAQVP